MWTNSSASQILMKAIRDQIQFPNTKQIYLKNSWKPDQIQTTDSKNSWCRPDTLFLNREISRKIPAYKQLNLINDCFDLFKNDFFKAHFAQR